MKEFVLLYEDVRQAGSPAGALMELLQSTYDAGADLAKWDRTTLERSSAPATEPGRGASPHNNRSKRAEST
ncbi:MAG: DUF5996 family protein, partial [Pyrinomonadaceae bacterium]